ncbi:Nuclear transport factor 2 Eukaryote [Macrophomina phaseolina MS6]|uniref:Nuclear transport factor 2 Eukaryote n=1 Tax=Macrophomina phaseolina (strain MS6) TaxID=1126212 RepID=K2RPA2_MACPH|nr:Nuclear transport factor 2 Eukaryote [Macrophomina phaseolina MS6]
MATVLPLDVQTKVAAEVSEAFADAYYTALQAARHTLSSFYVLHEATADGKTVPAIAWNGNLYESGAQFQEAFVELMPEYSYFEVQSLDAQVLNPVPPAPRVDDVEDAMVDGADGGKKDTPVAKKKEAEELVGSVLVLVNGFVRLKEKKEGPQKGFSETFVLVPNKEWSRKDGGRRWVVQNQNFRYVV